MPWSSREIAYLRNNADLGAEGLSDDLRRTIWSVRNQARRQRISLRKPSSRRGLLLGQPRHLRLSETDIGREMKDAVLRGEVDARDLERAVQRRWAVLLGAPPCPRCGVFPQEAIATGLCSDCHLKELIRAYEEGSGRAIDERHPTRRIATSQVRAAFESAKKRASRRESA